MEEKDLTQEQKDAFKKLRRSIALRSGLVIGKTLGLFFITVFSLLIFDVKCLNMSEGFMIVAGLINGFFLGRYFLALQKKEQNRIVKAVNKILNK